MLAPCTAGGYFSPAPVAKIRANSWLDFLRVFRTFVVIFNFFSVLSAFSVAKNLPKVQAKLAVSIQRAAYRAGCPLSRGTDKKRLIVFDLI